MRLFVAVELPAPLVDAAAAVSAAIRERVARIAPHARLTWIPPERMHLTVRFIGGVDDATTDRVLAALRDPIPGEPFPVAFASLGTFPSHGVPRVIWLGLRQGVAALQAAEREITARLIPIGIPAEARPFSPHLTLARVRDANGLHGGSLPVEPIDVPPAEGLVDAITLFESRLSPKGPTYAALQRTPFRRD
jgi:RNA 2',3'-cyclic 3'-phosphodiesterase